MDGLKFTDCLLLITDDDSVNRLILRYLLKDIGIMIKEVTNGEECLEAINESTAKRIILLLDLNMPIMSGYEVIESMKNNKNLFGHVKTIVVSASLRYHFEESGLSNHIEAYIEKPVNKDDLLRWVLSCAN